MNELNGLNELEPMPNKSVSAIASEPKAKKPDPIAENFPLFGLGSLLYGIFFCFCLYKNVSGVTSPLICIATIGYYLLSFKALHIEKKKSDWFYILCTFLLGLSNMMTLNYVILFFNYCGIILLLFVYLIRHFYETRDWNFSKYTSMLILTMCCSISHILDPLFGFRHYMKEKGSKSMGVIVSVLIGLAISVPLLIIICALLLSADAVFRNLADYLFSDLLKMISPGSIFLIIFLTCFGLCASFGILAELVKKHFKEEMPETRVLEPVIAITFTSILTVIYLVFSVIQIMYLFIGNMTLPKGYTYAQYAREGFFQLLFVCLINLILVLICTGRFKENIVLKVILTIICGCTMIMIASSTLRMKLYIDEYALTFLRVFVLVSLLVISLCLIGIVIHIYQKQFPLFSYMLVCVSICYILFSFAKPDYWIATYNVTHSPYATHSYEYLYQLSPDAAPVLSQYGYFDPFTKEEAELFTTWDKFEDHYYTYYQKHRNDPDRKPRNYDMYRSIYRSMYRYKHLNIRNFNVSAYLAGTSIMNRLK